MNTVDVANFFDNVSYGKGLLVQFKKSITPLSELNLKDQKILDEAGAWLNLRAVTSYVGGHEKGVLISMSRIGQRFYVYEKIIQDKDRPEKGNTLVKDEVVCKTYESSSSAMAPIIKSIKKYCPDRAHEFIKFA
jgi:hypothetical protein